MDDRSLDNLERRLGAAGRNLHYPTTPDLRRRVRAGRPKFGAPARVVRLALALLVVLLLGAFALPPVRAAVVELLRIGAVRIVPATPAPLAGTPSPTATLGAPSTTPAEPPTLRGLAGETTLAEARRGASFPIRLPRYPQELGAPDRVYLQEFGASVVVLAWLDPAQPEQTRLVLHQLGPGSYAQKVQPKAIQETAVNGAPAVWTTGPYLLQFLDESGQPILGTRYAVEGHVLIWVENDITYRLESRLSLEEAVRIAESLGND